MRISRQSTFWARLTSSAKCRCPLYEKEPWRDKGLRVLPVDRYLAFYLPVEPRKTVAILRILYGRRNLEKRLE